LVRMRGRTERSVFDRSITPMSSIPNRLIIPRDRWAYIVEEFGQTKLTNQVGTRQNLNFKKFMGCVVNCKVNHLYLDDITGYELTETEDAAVQSLIEGQSRVPLTLSLLVSALKR
jgi:IS1 family transposase